MNEYPDPDDLDALLAADARGFEHDDRGGDSGPLGAVIIDWRHLTDRDSRAAWDALRDWVEWFVIRYRVPESTVPACWFRHGQLVEELSALHTAHVAAFDDSDAGFGPIGWHERLSLAQNRLTRAYAGGCSDSHRDIIPRTNIGRIDETEWDAWADTAHGDTPVSHNRKEERS